MSPDPLPPFWGWDLGTRLGKIKKLRISMTPKLANEAFSVKSTQIMCLERHKEHYNTATWTRKRGM